MPQSMDFLSLFYAESHNRESLLSSIDSLLGTERLRLTLVPYASQYSLSECFKVAGPTRNFSILTSSESATLIELVFRSRETDALRGMFFVFEHPSFSGVFIMATLESAEFVRRALLPFFEHNPRIYLTFLRHDYLHTLLTRLQEAREYTELVVARASLVSRFGVGQKETVIPSVSWPGLRLEGAFQYAAEQNGWFRSLTFEAARRSKVLAEISIQRNGIVRTDGDLSGVYDNLVLPICDLINNNIRQFNNRSRRDNPELAVRPLSIDFGREQFDTVEENARFIEAMRNLNNASVSVIHGNPYISLSVVDYIDGSTFDLWVLNTRELVIVPQLKSSVSSIKRVISCVFDNYAEGIIKDFATEAE